MAVARRLSVIAVSVLTINFLAQLVRKPLWDGRDTDSISFATEVVATATNDAVVGLNETLRQAACAWGLGDGPEDHGGWKLLTEKVAMAPPRSSPRLLCLVYTHPPMHPLTDVAATTWAQDCDGFLAASTEHHGGYAVPMVHKGPEAYQNMWQKVRSLWEYVHREHPDYDYYHLGGDDMYVLVRNLRWFLSRNANETLFVGQRVFGSGQEFVHGGGGYTLSRRALERLVTEALPQCHVHKQVSYEDRMITQCFRQIGILPAEFRDETGASYYHGSTPHSVYVTRPSTDKRASFGAKAAAYGQSLPLNGDVANRTLSKLDAAARYSVSFHGLHTPFYLMRVHAILNPSFCPIDSPLGIVHRTRNTA